MCVATPSARNGIEHVFQHRALRQQVVLLKHEADLPAAEVGERGLVELERILAGEADAAGGRRLERAEDRQQRALAGAAGTEDGEVFAASERERHAVEHAERLARRGKFLDDVVRRRDRRRRSVTDSAAMVGHPSIVGGIVGGAKWPRTTSAKT